MFGYLSWRTVTEMHVGPVVLRPHGILIAIGFFAGAFVARRYTRLRGISDEQLWHVLSWAIVGGLVGMRAAWVLGHWRELHDPLEVLAVWHGGMSLLGGLIGAVAFGLPVALRGRLPILPLLDSVAPGLAVGIVIGRISDLVIGDHLGKPTGLPWGFRYAGADHPLSGAPSIGTVVHPVALYDVVFTTLLLVVLIRFLRRPRAPGSAIALFALWYGTFRLATDFLQTDPPRLLGLTGSQLTSAVVLVGVVGALVIRARQSGWLSPGPVPRIEGQRSRASVP